MAIFDLYCDDWICPDVVFELSSGGIDQNPISAFLGLIGNFVAGVLLLFCFGRVSFRDLSLRLYIVLSIAAATALFAIPVLDGSLSVIPVGAISLVFTIASIYMVAMCLSDGFGKGTQIFSGAYLGTVYLFVFLGIISGLYLEKNYDVTAISLALVYLVLLVAVLSGFHRKGKSAQRVNGENESRLAPSLDEEVIRGNRIYVDRYRLSNREVDVFVLAVAGRNAAAIADKLYISENTVRSHLKNIYKKLDVHSHQELLLLAENLEEERQHPPYGL